VNHRERVQAALNHRAVDRVPRFEVWIDAFTGELGRGDQAAAYADQGQDGVMMPTRAQMADAVGRDGVDEWGRVWRRGIYVGGDVDTDADRQRYSLPLEAVGGLFDAVRIGAVRERYPDHALFFGSHLGPFTAAYMAMGFDRFFMRLSDAPVFVEKLMVARTGWCLAAFAEAVRLGAELLVLGDDAAHRDGPMIAPRLWRDMILPLHREIVKESPVPVIWHSDGNILPLLPMAVEAGFAGVHGLDPSAGIDLGAVKREFGRDLALIGNVDTRVLCGSNLSAVRGEVARCLEQGSPGGGYMLSTCNSIFEGMDLAAVKALFSFEADPDAGLFRSG